MRHSPIRWATWTTSSRLERVVAIMLIALAGNLLATSARAQPSATLVVKVAEFGSGSPIAGAEVFLTAAQRHTRSDDLGEARLGELAPGNYELHVRHIGFAAAAVHVDLGRDTARVSVFLKPSAAALDTVHVVASAITVQRQKEFEARRKRGLGRFIGPDVLDKESLQDFPVVAIQHFPGLALIIGRAGQWQLASRHGSCGVDTTYESLSGSGSVMRSESQGSKIIGSGSGARQTTAEAATSQSSCFSDHPCHVKLFLDDQPVAETDINIVHTSDLYGVEYYSTGNAPPRYQVSGAACGIILLWTKAGNSG